jgi:DNA-binding Xre family transcriptional regulator
VGSITRDFTGTGEKDQPLSVRAFADDAPMGENTRTILWANLADLMQERWGKENVNRLRLKAGIGSSALQELKAGVARSIGLDALEKLAGVFSVEPYQLLMPRLGADVTHWPFRRVTRERVLALSVEDLNFVEGQLEQILRTLESAALPAKQATEQARLDAYSATEGRRAPAPSPAAPGKKTPNAGHHPKKA